MRVPVRSPRMDFSVWAILLFHFMVILFLLFIEDAQNRIHLMGSMHLRYYYNVIFSAKPKQHILCRRTLKSYKWRHVSWLLQQSNMT